MKNIITFALSCLLPIFLIAQVDDFEDGSTENWHNDSNGNPIVNTTGGPNGVTDLYLFTSSDGAGAGGRLAIFNTNQWTGDYTTNGLTKFRMNVICIGSLDVTLRMYIEGIGGSFVTQDSFYIQSATGWQTIEFNVTASDLIGSGSAAATLTNVSKIGIFNASGSAFPGPFQIAEVGFDNIEGVLNTSTTSILKAIDFNLNPNPTSDFLNLIWTQQETADISFEIINIQGQHIRSITLGNLNKGEHTHQIDVSALNNGMYFLKVMADIESRTVSFIVQK